MFSFVNTNQNCLCINQKVTFRFSAHPNVDSVARLESFRALKFSKFETFRTLELSGFESFRDLKIPILENFWMLGFKCALGCNK